METALKQQFKAIIAEHTGLALRSQDDAKLVRSVKKRTAVLKIASPDEYLRRLAAPTNGFKAEWQKLILMLTTNETFFFRDRGQFQLLRDHIFPQIIHKHRRDRTLRIWSAGCSTGEEPYSLAVLINELIPDWRSWNILLLGTDIDAAAIQKAQTGVYSDWSFRMVDPGIQKRYFKNSSGWKPDPRIRSMVTFRTGNLRTDVFPDRASHIHDMDLILCRNVFIYFTHDAIAAVLKKFKATLAHGGFLMTGHSELHGQNLHDLSIRSFQRGTVYQRDNNAAKGGRSLPAHPLIAPSNTLKRGLAPIASAARRFQPHITGDPLITKPLSASASTIQASPGQPLTPKGSTLAANQSSPADGDDTAGATRQTVLKEADDSDMKTLYLQARAYANAGSLAEAIACCQKILAIQNADINACHLMACIMQEKGDLESAKTYLKRIIYFHPQDAAAYIEIASLYEAEQDFKRARKMWSTALGLLEQMAPHDFVSPYQTEASTLIRHIQRLIIQLGEPALPYKNGRQYRNLIGYN